MVALEHTPTDDSGFHIWTAVSDGTVTMHVSGELDMDTGPQLATHLAAHSAGRDLVVDLSACPFIDSSGITGLLACRQRLGPGSTMRLVGVTPSVARTLQICGLLEVLDVADQ